MARHSSDQEWQCSHVDFVDGDFLDLDNVLGCVSDFRDLGGVQRFVRNRRCLTLGLTLKWIHADV